MFKPPRSHGMKSCNFLKLISIKVTSRFYSYFLKFLYFSFLRNVFFQLLKTTKFGKKTQGILGVNWTGIGTGHFWGRSPHTRHFGLHRFICGLYRNIYQKWIMDEVTIGSIVGTRVLFLASEYVSKQVRVVPSINRPTRVNPSVFWRLKKEPWWEPNGYNPFNLTIHLVIGCSC
jgi:hypothetical protein